MSDEDLITVYQATFDELSLHLPTMEVQRRFEIASNIARRIRRELGERL